MNEADLRRFAVARSLFGPTTLKRALERFGFVQADPIRAPARAQDLTLRHRVEGYRAGDLERRYSTLAIDEDRFVNYGFVTSTVGALMHPRGLAARWPAGRRKRADLLLTFVRERGTVHPREVDRHFLHGTVTNYWGGSSSATTHLLELMHYGGLVRVVRREAGIRIYAVHEHGDALASPKLDATPDEGGPAPPKLDATPDEGGPAPPKLDAIPTSEGGRLDALVDVAVRKYAPLPGASLSSLVHSLRYAVPQWRGELRSAVKRAKQRLARAQVDGVDWYWPADERAPQKAGMLPDTVRLLAPFDPVVWDRRRFELFWGWAYRFEAYTPLPKRKLGYYALPLLWRDRVIGWGNLSVKNGLLQSNFGYVASRPPRDRAFSRELEAELDRMRLFLGLDLKAGESPDRHPR